MDTGESITVSERGHYGRYVATGHVVYMVDDTLMGVPFDIERLKARGAPVALLHGVQTRLPSGATNLAVSAEGTLVYRVGGATLAMAEFGSTLVSVSRDGLATRISGTRDAEYWPRLSPDNSQVAAFMGGGVAGLPDIWIYHVNQGTRERLVADPAEDVFPIWTPDGERIVFTSTRTGIGDLYWQRVDGSNAAEPLVKSETRKVATSWSPNGRALAFTELTAQNQRDIKILRVGDKPEAFIATPFDEVAASFSPDGHWIAYVSNESGERQVYVQPYPGPGRRVPISTDGGEAPVWSRDGRELFYFQPRSAQSGRIMVVDVNTGPMFRADTPRVLFEGSYLPQANGNPNYDVSRDGSGL